MLNQSIIAINSQSPDLAIGPEGLVEKTSFGPAFLTIAAAAAKTAELDLNPDDNAYYRARLYEDVLVGEIFYRHPGVFSDKVKLNDTQYTRQDQWLDYVRSDGFREGEAFFGQRFGINDNPSTIWTMIDDAENFDEIYCRFA